MSNVVAAPQPAVLTVSLTPSFDCLQTNHQMNEIRLLDCTAELHYLGEDRWTVRTALWARPTRSSALALSDSGRVPTANTPAAAIQNMWLTVTHLSAVSRSRGGECFRFNAASRTWRTVEFNTESVTWFVPA